MLQKVGWAGHAQRATIQHMGVDHRGFYIAVAEQFLNRAYILTAFQQVGGK